MLKPIITVLSISKSGKKIVLQDNTGAYEVTTNPGGYGTPNPDTPPVAVGFRFYKLNETTPYLNFISEDIGFIADLVGAGVELNAETLGLGVFPTGVTHIEYYVFQDSDSVVSVVNGSKTITVTSGTVPTAYDDALVGALLLNDSDEIQSNTLKISNKLAGSFEIDSTWDETATGWGIMLATQGTVKVLFTELPTKCISEKIGELASTDHCNDDVVQKLTTLSLWVLSAKVKFGKKDYTGANKLAVAAYDECNNCESINCKTCS